MFVSYHLNVYCTRKNVNSIPSLWNSTSPNIFLCFVPNWSFSSRKNKHFIYWLVLILNVWTKIEVHNWCNVAYKPSTFISKRSKTSMHIVFISHTKTCKCLVEIGINSERVEFGIFAVKNTFKHKGNVFLTLNNDVCS